MIHIALHFIVPLIVAIVFYREKWVKAWLIMTATIVIDIDHLLAEPIYDPMRCSINFHLLHTYPFIILYVGLSFFKKTRLVGLGLLIHIVLDFIDCIVQGNISF